MSDDASKKTDDAELDALVRDLSRKVNATDGEWVRENTPPDVPSIHDDFEGALRAAPGLDGAESSATVRAEALLNAIDDGGENPSDFEGARVVDAADFESAFEAMGGSFAGPDGVDADVRGLQAAADDIVATILAYEEKKAAGSAAGVPTGTKTDAKSRAEDALAKGLEGLGLELGGVERAEDGDDAELKNMMKQLAGELKAEKKAGVVRR